MLFDNLKFLRSQNEKTRSDIFLFPSHWALFRAKVITSLLLDTIRNTKDLRTEKKLSRKIKICKDLLMK